MKQLSLHSGFCTRFSMKMTGYWALYDQTQVPLFLAMRDFLNDVQEALRV